jgi:hypothetical protein
MRTLAACCALILLFGCDNANESDRYQIVTNGPVMMKIDKKTGQSWKWKPSVDGGGEWELIQGSR